jgi:salicylate hydroxylase
VLAHPNSGSSATLVFICLQFGLKIIFLYSTHLLPYANLLISTNSQPLGIGFLTTRFERPYTQSTYIRLLVARLFKSTRLHILTMEMTTEISSQKPFTIAIVGGGIGGIALAIALRRQNIPVQVYEFAPAFAEIGAGMAFGPNAVRSMELIDPAIRKAFTSRATKNGAKEDEETWINFRCGVGEPDLIAKVQTTDQDKTGLSSIHRAHFMGELADLIPEGIAHFGKKLVELEQLDSGKIQLTFEDGTTVQADAVVGCDGVRSKVRQILLEKKSPLEDLTFSGKYAYRGLIPMSKAKEALGDYLAGNSQMYLGPEGHILTYPIDHGKVMNVIAFKNQDTPWEHENWVLKSKGDEFKQDFEGWGKPVQSIVEV